MHKKLIYNGKSSADMGLVIQAPPVYTLAERDVEKVHVPGRNGDVIIDKGSYKNTQREYSLAKGYIHGPVMTTVSNGQELYEWLTSAHGKYVLLEDDYDPDVYRLATYVDSGSINDIFDKALTFNARFECKPQRFLKEGLTELAYPERATEITVHSLYNYEAKPEIKIEKIPAGNNAVTLMSVKSANGEEVSLITLKGDPDKKSNLIINSEEESCYDFNGNDASSKLSLNGKNFPVLKQGNNRIEISQYSQENFEIPSYNTLLQSKQEICESRFSPKDQTIASYENKYVIRSFDTLIKEREYSFEAPSYETRLTELCDEGVRINGKDYALSTTIQSPNKYTDGVTVEFKKATFNDFKQEFRDYGLDFLEITETSGGYIVKVVSGKTCYVKQSDRSLLRYSGGDTIIEMSSSVTESKELEILSDIGETITNDLPTFIKVTVNHGSNKVVSSIVYNFDFSSYTGETDVVNIYWKDKVGFTGLFGKAGWSKCEQGNQIIKYQWGGIGTKKFTLNGNLFAADNGYKLRFVRYSNISKDRLQYNFGVNSSEMFNVKLRENGNKIDILASKTGFYRFNEQSWFNRSDPTYLPYPITTIDTNASFKAEYIKDVPKYSNEIDWPTWLYNVPEYYNAYDDKVTGDVNILNSKYMKFKVDLTTYYRYYETVNDVERHSDYKQIHAKEYAKDYYGNDLKLDLGSTATIGEYFNEQWPDPNNVPSFYCDRANSINNQTPSENPYLPEWLRYEVEMKVKFNSDPTHEYTAIFENYLYFGEKVADSRKFVVKTKKLSAGDFVYDLDISIVEPIGEIKNVIDGIYVEFYDHPGIYSCKLNDDRLFEWKPNVGSKFYTHNYWYAELNDKIFNYDGDEIGYVTEAPSILFYSGNNKGGFYKYDNTNAWVYHDANDTVSPIIKISYRDTVMFYYVDELPSDYTDYYNSAIKKWKLSEPAGFEEPYYHYLYTTTASIDAQYAVYWDEKCTIPAGIIESIDAKDSNIIHAGVYDPKYPTTKIMVTASRAVPEWIKYLRINVKPSGNLNPLSVDFIVEPDHSGYYKSNAQVHWTNYSKDEVVLTTLVSESNTILHLKSLNSQEALSELQITVIPHWWML